MSTQLPCRIKKGLHSLPSSSNISNVKTVQADLINTYDLLNSNHLLITQEGFKKIEEIWGSKKVKK